MARALLESENPICELLEELVQCPVCLEIPRSVVLQCSTGHNICQFCRNRLEACPTCQSPFVATRNYLCEHLADKLDIIQTYILDAVTRTHKVERSYASVHTQTDCPNKTKVVVGCTQTNENAPTETYHKVKEIVHPAPVIAKGPYPCCIGSCMVMNDSYNILIGHLTNDHKDHFYEFPPAKNGIFTNKVVVDNTLPRDYDYAFYIKNMGLFFLHMTIYFTGNFLGHVQIANAGRACSLFNYDLNIIGKDHRLHHTGKVNTCRDPVELGKGFRVTERELMHVTDGKPFHCNITIRRMDVGPEQKRTKEYNERDLYEVLGAMNN